MQMHLIQTNVDNICEILRRPPLSGILTSDLPNGFENSKRWFKNTGKNWRRTSICDSMLFGQGKSRQWQSWGILWDLERSWVVSMRRFSCSAPGCPRHLAPTALIKDVGTTSLTCTALSVKQHRWNKTTRSLWVFENEYEWIEALVWSIPSRGGNSAGKIDLQSDESHPSTLNLSRSIWRGIEAQRSSFSTHPWKSLTRSNKNISKSIEYPDFRFWLIWHANMTSWALFVGFLWFSTTLQLQLKLAKDLGLPLDVRGWKSGRKLATPSSANSEQWRERRQSPNDPNISKWSIMLILCPARNTVYRCLLFFVRRCLSSSPSVSGRQGGVPGHRSLRLKLASCGESAVGWWDSPDIVDIGPLISCQKLWLSTCKSCKILQDFHGASHCAMHCMTLH